MQGFVEQKRQRAFERLAGSTVRVRVVGEQAHEVAGCAAGGVDAARTECVLDDFTEEIGDRLGRHYRHHLRSSPQLLTTPTGL